MGLKEKMRRLAIEILLIILISLFLSLIYNAVSPTGLRILPKKAEPKKDVKLIEVCLSGRNNIFHI
jgi:hypothetical protein